MILPLLLCKNNGYENVLGKNTVVYKMDILQVCVGFA